MACLMAGRMGRLCDWTLHGRAIRAGLVRAMGLLLVAYVVGLEETPSKPMASIPMLSLSWMMLLVMAKLVTLPSTFTDSLFPVFRSYTYFPLMVRLSIDAGAPLPD